MYFSGSESYRLKPLKADAKVIVSCELPLWRNFSGKIDVYSVSYNALDTCNVAGGKLLGSLHCGSNRQQNTTTLDFANKERETYYVIGE